MKAFADEELVMLVKATGDTESYTELIKRHQSGLLAFLHRLAGNNSNIDDIAQVAMLRAYRKIDQFREESSFRTWLFQIGYREYLQLMRRNKRTGEVMSSVESQPGDLSAFDPGMSLDLNNGLARLSTQERAAILLCDANGMSHSEAATAMDAPLGSVKTYVKRARHKMRLMLMGTQEDK